MLSQGWGITGSGRGWWPCKLPVRCESKIEGESSSKSWSAQHTGFPTPSGDMFASFVCTCLHLLIPCKGHILPTVPHQGRAGDVVRAMTATNQASKSTLGASLQNTQFCHKHPAAVFVEGLSDHSQHQSCKQTQKKPRDWSTSLSAGEALGGQIWKLLYLVVKTIPSSLPNTDITEVCRHQPYLSSSKVHPRQIILIIDQLVLLVFISTPGPHCPIHRQRASSVSIQLRWDQQPGRTSLIWSTAMPIQSHQISCKAAETLATTVLGNISSIYYTNFKQSKN